MRLTRWLPPVLVFGLGVVACSSSSSNGGPSSGSPMDGSADQSAPSCGSVAACYGVQVAVDSSSPANCGGNTTVLFDYSAVAGDGPISIAGCTGSLSNCVMTYTCGAGATAASYKVTLTANGFSGTVTQGACQATLAGTRLAACPVVTPGDDGGPDATTTSEAGTGDGGADAAGDVAVGADAGGADGGADGAADGAPDAGAGTGSDGGGQEAATVEAGSEAGQPEAAADAAPEGGDDGGGADAGAPEGGDAAATD